MRARHDGDARPHIDKAARVAVEFLVFKAPEFRHYQSMRQQFEARLFRQQSLQARRNAHQSGFARFKKKGRLKSHEESRHSGRP